MATLTKKDWLEAIIKDNNILWNDLVEIEILNPNYKKTFFRKYPKTIKFCGAFGYHYGDDKLDLCVDDGLFKTKIISFDFEQVINVRHLTEKEIKNMIKGE